MKIQRGMRGDICIAYGRKLLSMLAKRLGVSVFDLTKHSNRKDVVICRQVCVWWLCKNTSLSYPEIGAVMGFHRATMQYAYKNIEDKLDIGDDIATYLVKRLNEEI